MQWLGFGVALAIGFALALNWFAHASPSQIVRGIRRAVIVLVLVLVLLLVATGRLHWLFVLASWAVPAIIMLAARMRREAAARGPRPGQASQVRTRFLDMRLDHDTGELDGNVVAGRYEGRTLSAMSLEELRELLGEIAADPDSLNVLSAYMDRAHGDDWRAADEAAAGAGNGRAGRDGAMTRDEAWRVLGLEPGASDDEIRAAHRRLMKQMHPDHGGSDYLAAKINEAKDTLLGR